MVKKDLMFQKQPAKLLEGVCERRRKKNLGNALILTEFCETMLMRLHKPSGLALVTKF
jgi:hypothetical protein